MKKYYHCLILISLIIVAFSACDNNEPESVKNYNGPFTIGIVLPTSHYPGHYPGNVSLFLDNDLTQNENNLLYVFSTGPQEIIVDSLSNFADGSYEIQCEENKSAMYASWCHDKSYFLKYMTLRKVYVPVKDKDKPTIEIFLKGYGFTQKTYIHDTIVRSSSTASSTGGRLVKINGHPNLIMYPHCEINIFTADGKVLLDSIGISDTNLFYAYVDEKGKINILATENQKTGEITVY